MADPVPGVRLFEVLREDAVGTFQRGEDVASGEPVAVRRLHGHLCDDDAARMVFAEELRRIATLDHPRLVRVRRHDTRAAVPWMVTDPLDGETLENSLAAAPWPAAVARAFVADVLTSFVLLEKRRQFHAAPIPSRFVRIGDGWRLSTFRDVRAEDEAPRVKGRAAEPAWAAPETDSAHPDVPKARTLSAWAAGALWLGCVTGRPPPARGGAAHPALSESDRAILARWLDPSAAKRPYGADACLALLTDAAGGAGASGGAPNPPPSPVAPLVVKKRAPR